MLAALLVIDSKDRSSGVPENFTYNLQSSGFNKVKSFRVNKISIPFSWNTVVASSFRTIFNGTGFTIPVAAGQWPGVILASNLQSSLNSIIGNTWTVTYNSYTNSFTVSVATGTFHFDFSIPSPPLNPYYNIGVQLGFITVGQIGTISPATPVSTFTSPYFANLSGTTNVYVLSQSLQLYGFTFLSAQQNNVLQSVPVNVEAGSLIVWQNSVETTFKYDTRSMVNFDFSLVDDSNIQMNLNGQEWTLELQVFYDL
jgi:hypothetical protein